jgi:hypothetical protein
MINAPQNRNHRIEKFQLGTGKIPTFSHLSVPPPPEYSRPIEVRHLLKIETGPNQIIGKSLFGIPSAMTKHFVEN